MLVLAFPGLYRCLLSQARESLAMHLPDGLDQPMTESLLKGKLIRTIFAVSPFLAAAAAASVLSSLVSSGWAFSAKPVKVNFERISPVQGLKNLFSLRSVVSLLISLAKLTVIVVIVWVYLHDKKGEILALRWAELDGTLLAAGQIVFGVLVRIVLGLVVIAGADLLYQRWNYVRNLRMTRQEVKEERKQYELSPEVKGRMRAVQLEMVRRRMLQEVPKADVVLANPTHVAVAIKYDGVVMDAPTVIAKGPDLLAQTIKDIARKHDVPVLHRPELARALYRSVDVGKAIPDTLFVAVAEVLAMIYRLRKQRQGGG